MKKILIGFVGLLILLGVVFALPFKTKVDDNKYDYLRIHIRANSNCEADQKVKYKIKDKLVEFLTPYLCEVPSKEEALQVVDNLKSELENVAISELRASGFSYSVGIKLSNEYFPTRTYNNTTLESGFYDAIIVELGSAVGDNWWCVMYPPLCFTKSGEGEKVEYKSRLVEWFKRIFN